MGAEAQQQLSVRGLQNAAGFLQSRIADRIETRYTPKLRFVLDPGTKNVAAVGEILERIRREQSGEAVDSMPEDSAPVDSMEDDFDVPLDDDATYDDATDDEMK
jgi:ribosome-binding factor A